MCCGSTVSDLAAQVLDECPDTEIASALDNYRVAWVVSKGRLGDEGERGTLDSPGTYWERVTDEAHDGVDSLRSGAIGDNEHAELTARIAGGTTLSFWWKVDSQERADRLTFSAEPEIEAGTADGPSAPPAVTVDPIDGKRDWTRVEVDLPGEAAYRARWSYEKDNSGWAGADAVGSMTFGSRVPATARYKLRMRPKANWSYCPGRRFRAATTRLSGDRRMNRCRGSFPGSSSLQAPRVRSRNGRPFTRTGTTGSR